MPLKRGRTQTWTHLTVWISANGSIATATPIQHDESTHNMVMWIHRGLNTLLDWHRANDQPLRKIIFHVSPDTAHFAMFAIGQWIAATKIPKMIEVRIRNMPYEGDSQLTTLVKGRSDVQWEDDQFNLLGIPGYGLVIDLHDGDNPISCDGLDKLIASVTLHQIMHRAAIVAGQEGSIEVLMTSPWRFSPMWSRPLEAAVQAVIWPDTVKRVGYAWLRDSSQPNWLEMTAPAD